MQRAEDVCTEAGGSIMRVAIFSNVNRILYASAHFPVNETMYTKREGGRGASGAESYVIIRAATKLFQRSFTFRITVHST